MGDHLIARGAHSGQTRGAVSELEEILARSITKVMKTQNYGHPTVSPPPPPAPTSQYSHLSLYAPPLNNNVEKPGFGYADPRMQIRLLTEQLNRRMERRWGERIRAEKEREAAETQRKLSAIREEARAEIETAKRELDFERRKLEEQFAEKERLAKHRLELKEQEHAAELAWERRQLETRLSEFLLAKEQFDRARDDFRRMVDAERGLQEAERERLAVALSQVNSANDADEVKRRYEEKLKAEDERDALRRRVTEVEAELRIAKENYRRQLAESRDLAAKLRERDDYAELQEENRQLRLAAAERSVKYNSEGKTREAQRASEMEAANLKIRELKLIVSMMGEKLKVVQGERDFLRAELHALRRQRWKEGGTKSARTEDLKRIRRAQPEESTDSISSNSEGGEIQAIKDRLKTLDQCAKDLDACIDQIDSASRVRKALHEGKQLEEPHTPTFEDFVSTPKLVKATKRELLENSADSFRSASSDAETILVRTKAASFNVAEKRIVPKEGEKSRIHEAQRLEENAVQSFHDSHYRERMELTNHQQEPTPKFEETLKPRQSAEEEFAEKMRRREEERKIARGETREESSSIKESAVTQSVIHSEPFGADTSVKEKKPEMTSSTGFSLEGVDPVMARYMEMVQRQREKEKAERAEEERRVQTASSTTQRKDEEVEVDVSSLKVDRAGDSDDEIHW